MRLLLAVTIMLLSVCQISAQNIITEEHLELSGTDEIEVRGKFCDVTIEGIQGEKVFFDGVIKGPGKRDFSIMYRESGSSLEVWVETPRNNWGQVNCELKFRTPIETEVKVDNSSGSIFASRLKGRSYQFETSSGDQEIENITGDLVLKSSSGQISLNGLVGDLDSKSSSGGQKITDINGNIRGKSSSGRISFRKIEGDIDAETTSGGISLDDFKGGLELESTSGSVRGDAVELTSDSYFESSSGSIDMELVNKLESLSFDLKANSGSLRVGSTKADNRYLDKRSEGILVKGVSTSGSQRYDN